MRWDQACCLVFESLEIMFKGIKKEKSKHCFRNKGGLYYLFSLSQEFYVVKNYIPYSIMFQNFFPIGIFL